MYRVAFNSFEGQRPLCFVSEVMWPISEGIQTAVIGTVVCAIAASDPFRAVRMLVVLVWLVIILFF